MNINRLFQVLNQQIALLKTEIGKEANEVNRSYLMGVSQGISLSLETVNAVNHAACDEEGPLRNCIGYGSRKSLCDQKVPKRLLQLWCDKCKLLRDEKYEKLPLNIDLSNKIGEPVYYESKLGFYVVSPSEEVENDAL